MAVTAVTTTHMALAAEDYKALVTALILDHAHKEKARGLTWTQIEEDFGIARPQMALIRKGAAGVGETGQTRYAERFYRGSLDALRAAALEHHAAQLRKKSGKPLSGIDIQGEADFEKDEEPER